ncbi:hypothetical protein [Geoalkalibacter halelectricus]|uniref:DUF2281 domain-containing protein n=1 Tax=Geoalkalibacter halelectricus TaxID=2847045 RepID=A0ABY5ZGU2_9BACT|nr:hypothetical protein [Geoalkalibacter halelectricus]MDO3377987.1 hypothetical protein [Geoalkalibacter halelectricus]UWZ78288.1 hypothetical protein L9S41_11340 [Geoalkalibacter halelectricus]
MTKATSQLDLSALPPASRRELVDFYEFLLERRTRAQKVAPPKQSFTDLCGKLTWKGDAVASQRNLRDEW